MDASNEHPHRTAAESAGSVDGQTGSSPVELVHELDILQDQLIRQLDELNLRILQALETAGQPQSTQGERHAA